MKMNNIYYYLSRQRENLDQIEYANYNDYSNTLAWQVNQEHATKFEDLERAKALQSIGASLNNFGGKEYELKLMKLTETIEEM